MLTILLVDDESLVLEMLSTQIDWARLGISQVLTAQSAKQAMDVFQRQRVDILLCDIEMPQKSGLELLRDLKAHQISVVSVLLTAHADFSYAKEAVSLGALEYMTKPAPVEQIEECVARAVGEVCARRKTEGEALNGRRWATSHQWLKHHFWLDVSAGRIPASFADMAAERNARCIAEPLEREYILLQLMPSDNRSGIPYGDLERLVQDLTMKMTGAEAVIAPMEATWAAILPRRSDTDCERCAQSARELMDTLREYQSLGTVCCIVDHVPPQALRAQIRRVYRRAHDRTDLQGLAVLRKPLPDSNRPNAAGEIAPAPFEEWYRLMSALETECVIAKLNQYLCALNASETVPESVLNNFLHDFLQMIYSVLREQGIQSAALYDADNVRSLLSRATQGIHDLTIFCGQIIIRTAGLMAASRNEISVSEQICRYISGHLGEELSRDMIAAQVGFSPEHVSRLFKQETGMNLIDYIQTERLNAACNLLLSTAMPISEIAMRTGYDNFAYFSKAFRKFTGVAPSQYRKGR